MIRHKEFPVKFPPKETNNIVNNQLAMNFSTGGIQALQALYIPATQEVIVVMTKYNTGEKKTTQRVSCTGINGSNTAASDSGTSAVASFTSPTPPYVFNWNGRIGNIRQTATPNFRETSELQTSIDRIFSNDYNAPSVGSKIIHDELSVSSRRDFYSCCRMNIVAETIQPMVPQTISHGLLNIDIFNENDGIWSPATSSTRKTTNTTHGSTFNMV